MEKPFQPTISTEGDVSAVPTVKKETFYVPELDILRFFAFFAVFVVHAFPRNPEFYHEKLGLSVYQAKWISDIVGGGSYGVDIFFTLSAYLITEILTREYEKTGKINIWAFYVRRGLRIYPLYYFFLLLTVFAVPYIIEDALNFPHNISFFVFAGNWTCVFFDLPHSVAAPLWSVSVEEQFYLAIPFLLAHFGVKRLRSLGFFLLALSFTVRLILVSNGAAEYQIWCNTFTRLDPIAGGILLSVFLRSGAVKRIENSFKRFLLGIFGVFLCVAAARYNFFYWEEWGFLSPSISYLLVALGSSLILLSFIHPRGVSAKRYAPLIYLGRISYGLYVFHILGLRLAEKAVVYFAVTGVKYAVFIIIGGFTTTLVLAMLSYKFLEEPFLRLKERFTYIKSH